ncbi:MAG: response regulator [Prevotella sp.]
MPNISRLKYLIPLLLPLLSMLSCERGHNQVASPSVATDSVMAMLKTGEDARNQGDFRLAIETHDSCIKLTEAMGDTVLMAMAYNNQGTNMRRIGDLTTAASLHYGALAMSEKYSDRERDDNIRNLAYALNGIGNVYLTTRNFKAADRALRYALRIEQGRHNPLGEAINYANIGSIKEQSGDTDSARILYNLSMQKNREARNTLGISLCYSYLANLEKAAGNTAAALAAYRKAYAIGRSTHDAWHWIDACASLASLYLDLHRPDSAAPYIMTGLDAARAIDSKEHLMRLSSLMAGLMETRGDISKALAWTKTASLYRDSLQATQTLSDIQDIRIEYISDLTKAELDTARRNVERERRISHVTMAAATLIVILSVIVAVSLYRLNTIRRRAAAEREIFYRNMTHRLRTPMTVILGMVEQLGSHIPPSDHVAHQSLSAARRQSYNLLQLIKMLIAASREGRLDDVSLPDTDTPTSAALTAVPDATVPPPASSSRPSQTAAGDDRPRRTALVAEDNDDVAMMLCSVLRDNGYDVVRAADGMEALERLKASLPDILVTDIAMPRMDGIQLIRHVRADDTMDSLPVVVVSARVEDSDRLDGIEAGAEVYLAKPFIARELLLRMDKLIGQRETLRRRFTAADTDDTADPTTIRPMSAADREYITRVDTLIDMNINCTTISSQQLADMMATSRSQLNRRIKTITGMPTTLYIRGRRMVIAKRLLRDTPRSISEIETICGFDSPGYFSRMFKAMTGMTPSEYRRLSSSSAKDGDDRKERDRG